MSRFSGRDKVGFEDPETGQRIEPGEERVTVPTKAFMTIGIYVPAVQKTTASTILITSTRAVDENTEVVEGRDGDTGEEVEITVRYKQ